VPSPVRRKPPARVAVVADSSACLPSGLLEENGVQVVPLIFQFDGEQFKDGDLPAAEFYHRLHAGHRPPSTAAPGPGDFLEAFRRAQQAGARDVICLTLSSEYSATHAAAAGAAELSVRELPGLRVEVVDTGGLAMTHGFAVLEAARAARAGASLNDIAALARAVVGQAEMIGMLDTMRYLAKSGRVPWIVHLAASLLHIRPVIAFERGKPRSIARVRTFRRGLEELVRYLGREARDPERTHVAVMHANAPARAAELAQWVRDGLHPAELFVTEVTPVMGVHTGPGFLGLAFYSDERIPRPAPASARKWRLLLERDVGVLERELGPVRTAGGTPAAVVLVGPPGAGKSHLARALAARHPFAHLDSDSLRRAVFKRPAYTNAENLRLFKAYHELMGRLLRRGVSVICDATNLKEAYRLPLYEIAEKSGATLVIVQVETPREVVESRLDRRSVDAGPWDKSEAGRDIYERMQAEAEPVQREHLVVDASGDITEAVAQVLQQAGVVLAPRP